MFKPLSSSFVKKVFVIAAPIMVQNLLTTFAQLIDNLMVGSLGANAIAAVGSANMIFTVIMFMGFGIAEGASIFLAQQTGAKQRDQLHYTFIIGIGFSLLLGVGATLFVGLKHDWLLGFYINVKDALALDLANEYIRYALFSYIFILLNICIASSFRATGHKHQPVVAGVAAILINTALNYCLIYGHFGFPQWGVAGAAIATVISRIIELGILIFFMLRNKVDFLPHWSDVAKVPTFLIKQVSHKSLPLIFNEFLWASGQAALLSFYGSRAAVDLAAAQISNTMTSMLFTVMSGFAVSVSILVGHKLGGDKIKEAKEDAYNLFRLGILVGLTITGIAYGMSYLLPYLYDNVETSTTALASHFLITVGCFFPNYMLAATSFFILRSGGDTRGVLIMDAGFMWVVCIPLAYLLTYYSGLPILQVYIGVQLIDLFKTLVGLHRIRQEKWAVNLTRREQGESCPC